MRRLSQYENVVLAVPEKTVFILRRDPVAFETLCDPTMWHLRLELIGLEASADVTLTTNF